jgi:hypothetical protein
MDTLQINVKGWPPEHVQLVKKYAEEVGSAALRKNGLPNVPEEKFAVLPRRASFLAREGSFRITSNRLPQVNRPLASLMSFSRARTGR